MTVEWTVQPVRVQDDWAKDAKGKDRMNYFEFYESMFELIGALVALMRRLAAVSLLGWVRDEDDLCRRQLE